MVTVALVAFGVAIGAVSLYLGIVVGSALTHKHHADEVRRLKRMVTAMRDELRAWERGERPKE